MSRSLINPVDDAATEAQCGAMTKQMIDLDKHEAADKAMTPGPWEFNGSCIESLRNSTCVMHCVQNGTGVDDRCVSDVESIVLMRNDHAAMVAELREARARVAELETQVDAYQDASCDHRHPCRCGSGGHPRRCLRHPMAFDMHCRELGYAAKQEEKWIARKERIDELTALASTLLDSVQASYDLFTPAQREEERLVTPEEAYAQFAAWSAIIAAAEATS